MPVASRDPVPEVNKVIQLCLWGAEEVRDKQQAAKEKEKKQAQRKEDREAEKKKETGATETTAYLQLEGPLPTYSLLGLQRSCLLPGTTEKGEERRREQRGGRAGEKGASSKQPKKRKDRKRKRQGTLPTYSWRDHCLPTTHWGCTEAASCQAPQRKGEKREEENREASSKQQAQRRPVSVGNNVLMASRTLCLRGNRALEPGGEQVTCG